MSWEPAVTERGVSGLLQTKKGTKFLKGNQHTLDFKQGTLTSFTDSTISRKGKVGRAIEKSGNATQIALGQVLAVDYPGKRRFLLRTAMGVYTFKAKTSDNALTWVTEIRKHVAKLQREQSQKKNRQTAATSPVSNSRRLAPLNASAVGGRNAGNNVFSPYMSNLALSQRSGVRNRKTDLSGGPKRGKRSTDLYDEPPPAFNEEDILDVDIPPPPSMPRAIKPGKVKKKKKLDTIVFNLSSNRRTYVSDATQQPASLREKLNRATTYLTDQNQKFTPEEESNSLRRVVRNVGNEIIKIGENDAEKDTTTKKFLQDTLFNSETLVKQLFQPLDDQGKQEFVDKMFKKEFEKGENLIMQGDIQKMFYIIAEGTIETFNNPRLRMRNTTFASSVMDFASHKQYASQRRFHQRDTTSSTMMNMDIRGKLEGDQRKSAKEFRGEEVFVSSHTKGSLFGDLSLLYGEQAQMTVRAGTRVVAWAMDSSTFLKITTESVGRQYVEKMKLLVQSPLMKSDILTKKQLKTLSEAAEFISYKAGEVIYEKGSPLDKMFWLKSGKLYVLANPGDKDVLNEVEGEFFYGETACLREDKNAVQIVASTEVVGLELQIEEISDILGPIQALIEKRLKGNSGGKYSRNNNNKPLLFDSSGLIQFDKAFEKIRASMRTRLTTRFATQKDETLLSNFLEDSSLPTQWSVDSFEFGARIDQDYETVPPLLENINTAELLPVNLLGQGNYGSVHLVKLDTDKDIHVLGGHGQPDQVFSRFEEKLFALKIIKKNADPRADQEEMFRHEKCAWAEVSYLAPSHFVAKLYHSFCDSKNYYFLAEYCSGKDLHFIMKNVIPQRRLVVPAHLQFYLACAVLGLEAIHSREIIFRDLKTENMLIPADGYAKISDFGLAKKSLRSTTLCGTPGYMAPEIIAGKGHNQNADFWSLGVLLFELVFGYLPFWLRDDTDTQEVTLAHQAGKFERLEKFNVKVVHSRKHYEEEMSKQEENLLTPKEVGTKIRNSNIRSTMMSTASEESIQDKVTDIVLVPPSLWSLINRLIEPKPTKRLGCLANGFDGIKDHEFFVGFDWNAMENKSFVPKITIEESNEDDIVSSAMMYQLEYSDLEDVETKTVPPVDTVINGVVSFKSLVEYETDHDEHDI